MTVHFETLLSIIKPNYEGWGLNTIKQRKSQSSQNFWNWNQSM